MKPEVSLKSPQQEICRTERVLHRFVKKKKKNPYVFICISVTSLEGNMTAVPKILFRHKEMSRNCPHKLIEVVQLSCSKFLSILKPQITLHVTSLNMQEEQTAS